MGIKTYLAPGFEETFANVPNLFHTYLADTDKYKAEAIDFVLYCQYLNTTQVIMQGEMAYICGISPMMTASVHLSSATQLQH